MNHTFHSNKSHYMMKSSTKLDLTDQQKKDKESIQALLVINPFTASTCKISGLKDAWMHLQTACFLVL